MTEHVPGSSPGAALRWDPEAGFEFDFSAEFEGVQLRILGVPVPVDGTARLTEKPVDLDRLEILFKSQIDIEGESGQLQEATLQLEDGALVLVAKIEEVETAQLFPFRAKLPVQIPAEAPEAGGPVPTSMEEDDLDWDDEATFERLLTDMPLPLPTENRDDEEPDSDEVPRRSSGLDRLLKALSRADGEDDEITAEILASRAPGSGPRLPAPFVPDVPSDNQLLGAQQEAVNFIELLLGREALELEPGFGPTDIAEGVSRILRGGTPSSAMAESLSTWLLDQDPVADLYIDDDELAGLLAQW